MFSIKSTIFLNGIVGQMDQLIAHIVKVEGIGRCSDVALAVPVSSHLPMKSCYDHVMPDIELPPFVKQRVLYILLDDISLWISIRVFLLFFKDIDKSIYLINNHNPIASIGHLSRFNDPNITYLLLPINRFFIFLTLLVFKGLQSFKLSCKFGKFLICNPFSNMKGQRNHLKHIFLFQVIISF